MADADPFGRNLKRRDREANRVKHNDYGGRPHRQPGKGGGGSSSSQRLHRIHVAHDTLDQLAEDPAAYRAAENTVEYNAPPEHDLPRDLATAFEFEAATTLEACRKHVEAGDRVDALVFASAKNPGGGFLKGSVAQEESVAAASGLFYCLEGRDMYAKNRADSKGNMYHNAAIYCPDVPVIKDDLGNKVPRHFASFIVCAAPNCGARATTTEVVAARMRERVHLVLSIAAHHAASTLVLGAFGCGVFGNDPKTVASVFADAMHGPFRGCFRRVVFAIPGADDSTLRVFRQAFKDKE